ncbi:plasmid replication, integration and excision activator [Marinitenerispora sediminis]|uniref:Plasmid replication, integration and excision activator n=1 Tax=Marinitenerispora sediminis TaxID=1931232 RepID=A0A368T4V8_9ACTN|nr:plasmid replication, integration and excision activator [Marinitenerispora sediminis]RCV49834.1 plasmid replication, integration and excision activator [Marinitenerispora sediminis]RCV53920.1 plasmid replication, integration and excision activator [Marinitenerispora sediminis]RCV58392.1 plasmid replication, integration and excision activator [Marinitenerispora sediminis]
MAIQGALPVEFGTVFPHGAFALGVEAITDFETKRPQLDRESGLPLWAVDVIDADPEARGKAKSVKVKIAAEVCPTLPDEAAGLPFRPVEFDGMAVMPYVDDSGRRPRVAYSLRARGVKAPGATGRRAASAKDTA